MWNTNSNNNSGGFSGILGKITRTGPSRITAKETFEPMAPTPIDPMHMAKLAALNNMAGHITPVAHIPMPHVQTMPGMNGGPTQKDKFLGVLRGRH